MLYTGIFLFLVMGLFWTPFQMTKGVLKMENDKLTPGQIVLCLIPGFNTIMAEKKYYGKFSLMFYSFFIMWIGTAIRLAAYTINRTNEMLYTVTVIIFIASWIFRYVANVKFVFNVINDANAMETWKMWVFSFIYPLGQYYVGSFLSIVIKNQMKKAGAFKVE